MERNSSYVLELVPQHIQCSRIIQPPEVSIASASDKSEQVICYTIFIKDTQIKKKKTSCVLGLEKNTVSLHPSTNVLTFQLLGLQ